MMNNLVFTQSFLVAGGVAQDHPKDRCLSAFYALYARFERIQCIKSCAKPPIVREACA
ncbi:MAG: hypothetical protein WC966_01680 [Bradymonadales bacterium]